MSEIENNNSSLDASDAKDDGNPAKKESRHERVLRRIAARNPRKLGMFGVRWLSLGIWRRRVALSTAALFVGVVSVWFAKFGEWATEFNSYMLHQAAWLHFLMLPAGFAFVAWITRRYFRGAEGSGIPQAIIALSHGKLRDRLLSLPVVAAKLVLTVVGLVCGASIGREGPTIQIGAALMFLMSRFRWLGRLASPHNLVLAGSAAGIAAAFNTPLAGIMFAIEELNRGRSFNASSTMLTVVIFSGLVSLVTLGNYTYFGQTTASLAFDNALLPILLGAFLGGGAGAIFGRMAVSAAQLMLPWGAARLARERPVVFAACCGLMVACLGLIGGSGIYGPGYAETRAAMESGMPLPVLFGLLKMVASFASLISGIPGGAFAPSLTVGAGWGSDIYRLMALSGVSVPLGPLILLCMVGYLSGFTRAPITSFIIVMEMTAGSELLIPLMATALMANGVAVTINRKPPYHQIGEILYVDREEQFLAKRK